MSLAVLQHLPSACCFSCLADELHSTEPEVRGAAQMLVFLHAFSPAWNLCFKCLRTEKTIVRHADMAVD